MRKGIILTILLCTAIMVSAVPALAATTEVDVVKYAADGATILDETTVNYTWMEENLPVYGDGVTHYFHQGPVFEGNVWNPEEDVNVQSRDYGAVKGTNVKDLCDLVGGMSPGDEVRIKSPDGFNKWFAYESVYDPAPEQGHLVVCWYNGEESSTGSPQGTGYTGAFPNYYTGMRLIFFADASTNPYGYHVFGNWDMHEHLDEKYWHYYQTWPATSGLSVKCVSEIAVYSNETMLLGDANHDGKLSTTDAVLALRMAVSGIDTDPVADMNGDGLVTSLDALMILQVTYNPPPSPTLLWGPYITGTTTNSTTINWKTENATNGTLKYATEEYYTENGRYNHTIADTEEKELHHLVVTNLTLNTTYHYQLTVGNEFYGDYTFRTFPADGSFTFIVYGDTREETGLFTQQERHKLVADRIAKEENISFVIHTGDFICSGSDMEEWDDFFDAGRAMMANTTIYSVPGNHEYNHANYYDAFGVPEWYSFDCGDVHFTVLDSNSWADMTEQTKWLRDDLNCDATWKFVSFHHPPYSSDEYHPGGWTHLRDYWEYIFINNSVDAVVNGHVHVYERYEENEIQYVVLGCGGAPLYALAEEKIPGYQNSFEHTLGYAKITIEGNNATMEVIKVADISEDNKDVTYLHPPDAIFETVVMVGAGK